MKNPTFKIGIHLFRIVLLAKLFSCQEDEPSPPAVVQFPAGVLTVNEGQEILVTLALDRTPSTVGTIKLDVQSNGAYGKHYVTEPASGNGSFIMTIDKSEHSKKFKVVTNNNTTYDHGKFIVFTISNPTGELQLGPATTLTLFINDDEGPSLASFAANAGNLNESDTDGAKIQIPFSTPAKGPGMVKISMGNTTYGERFTTDPAPGNDGLITFSVLENEVGKSITVLPVDDQFFRDNYVVNFAIADVAGVVEKGPLTTYKLTIVDDELPSVANFAVASGEIDESNGEGIKIEILFSGPAAGTGEVQVNLPGHGYAFTVSGQVTNNVLKLPVQFGDPGVHFTLVPSTIPGCYDYIQSFTITSVSGVVKKGTSLNYSLRIKADDLFVASFNENTTQIFENEAEGYEVEVVLSKAAPFDEYVWVGASESARFTTSPSMYWDWYTYSYGMLLQFKSGEDKATFKVLPVNNAVKDGNYTAQFSLSRYCGYYDCYCVTGNGTSFNLTITDDD